MNRVTTFKPILRLDMTAIQRHGIGNEASTTKEKLE